MKSVYTWSLLLGLAACGTPQPEVESPTLTLEGPAEITAEALGPVDGPRAVLSDGTQPAEEALIWTVEPASVARVDGGVVQAIAPGEATVTVAYGEQSAAWQLTVAPRVHLVLDPLPPATLKVGETLAVAVQVTTAGGELLEALALTWTSSDPERAAVSASGEVRAVAPGPVFITVAHGSAQAMVELEVVE